MKKWNRMLTGVTAVAISAAMLLGGCAGSTPTPAGEGDTTTTPAETTTTTQATKKEMEIGGSTFTLDGKTFRMGTDPTELLEHLGEMKTTYQYDDNFMCGTMTYYENDDVIVETITYEAENCPAKAGKTALANVYFKTDRYSFDGVKVGDTVEKIDNTVERLTANYQPIGPFGGPCYWYDHDWAEGGSLDGIKWFAYFKWDDKTSFEQYPANPGPVPAGARITAIRILYDYHDPDRLKE